MEHNTIQYNIRLMTKTLADTATEITKIRIIKAVKQRHYRVQFGWALLVNETI